MADRATVSSSDYVSSITLLKRHVIVFSAEAEILKFGRPTDLHAGPMKRIEYAEFRDTGYSPSPRISRRLSNVSLASSFGICATTSCSAVHTPALVTIGRF